MLIKDSVWQGDFGYWQSPFIHQNILEIGDRAWHGFLTSGRGMVVCDVDLQNNSSIDWNVNLVRYELQFIDRVRADDYLHHLELASAEIADLMQTIATYDPMTEILLIITGCNQIEVNFLQRLSISPPDCYAQVARRKEEFHLQYSSSDPDRILY
jgi:hypothetical protein